MSQAAVIGGGISGLATALALSGRGHTVTLFEAEDDLGGLGTTFEWQGVHLERFYHCLLPDDDALLPRVRELGLEPQLLWRETKMGFMYRNRIWPMNTPRDLLSFGPLTPIERVRMGLMGLRARYGGLAPELDAITAEAVGARHGGRPVFRSAVEAAPVREDRGPLRCASGAVALEPHEPRKGIGARAQGLSAPADIAR